MILALFLVHGMLLLKKHPEIMKIVDCYFNIMKEHRLGKVGTHFLTNKKHQTTRFVRALIRGLTAALRNIPTLEIILNESIREMEMAGKNDKVSIFNKAKRLMKDAKNILFVIGLMQILEIYATVSLSAQHRDYFPTQVCCAIRSAKTKLKQLAESWQWQEEELKLGQCGSPSIDDARNETTISQNSLWIHWIFGVLGFLYLLNNHINVMYDLL